MDNNGLVRIGDANQGSRKKPKTASVRTLAKLKRHGAPLGCRVFQPCKLLNKGVKCALVRPKDALNTRQVLYKEAEKNKQDGIIASWIKNGETITDKRGGDRCSQKCEPKKQALRLFLCNLRGRKSHYNRKKSKRIYLQSDLNKAKLCVIYNATVSKDLTVSKSIFSRVFNEFNIGFRSPATDVCCTCYELDLKTKSEKAKPNVDKSVITKLMFEKRVHKIRAKCFYELMRNRDDEVTFCFDLQYSRYNLSPKPPSKKHFIKGNLAFTASVLLDQMQEIQYFILGVRN
ncbi:hypothetical protein J6590_106133 [Homalodisca vitripennis]|nr:hypothetical protein J6590_106133 [Homalodisca vitripennis]